MITTKIEPIEETFGSRARVKIMKLLAINEELMISQIIKRTKLNHTSVSKHLNFLINHDLVQLKTFGRIKIYRFKTENLRARSFIKFLNIWENKL
jgi:DNA-binding transcriptional ArsR family regulator